MLEYTTMTYLIVGSTKENTNKEILKLISKLWGKKVDTNIYFSQNPDIHVLESSNIKSIGIEDVKSFQKEMIYTPFVELVQIGVIFNAEKLTPQAQNSFLKTLEESSDTTAYILITQNEESLLPTVISRCSKIYSKEEKIPQADIIQEDIFKLNMLDAFQRIENISKERENTLEYIDGLEREYQIYLEEKIRSGEDFSLISESLQKILDSKKKIEANGNRRLVLESLYLDLTR